VGKNREKKGVKRGHVATRSLEKGLGVKERKTYEGLEDIRRPETEGEGGKV